MKDTGRGNIINIALTNTTATMPDAGGAVEIWLKSIHKEYGPALYRYALALTSSVEDAQDAVQEVFARISRESKRFIGSAQRARVSFLSHS